MMALATALAAGPSWAQTVPPPPMDPLPPVPSFNAPDPIVRSGSVTFDRGVTTAGVDIYTIASPTAVLDFRPTDANGTGTIDFQNVGTTAYFRGNADTLSFTVLNRIVPVDPARAIQFNGSVISQIQTGQTPITGGNVWFYSPGGIIVGATAAFDVGSLLLTAADPSMVAGSGSGGSGGGGVVISSTTSFRGGGATGRAVTIQPGASLNATQPGSYIALVAPVIDQGGAVRVNGSAAFVSAEAATLTIDQGLFDIQVGVGSDGGLKHSGTTTGPASLGGTDNQGIYMVAVPKNTAIAMLIGSTGRIGFDDATDLTIENGKIILSAGRNVVGGAIVNSLEPVSPIAANLTIGSGNFTSDTVARATTDAVINSLTGTPDFAGDLTLQAGGRAWLGARQAGAVMTIGGNVSIIADDLRPAMTAQGRLDAQGGSARVFAGEGGALQIAGNLRISAEAAPGSTPSSSSSPGVGSATGGEATLYAFGGSIDVAGTTTLSANVYQENSLPSGVPGPRLIGGRASVDIQDNRSTILLRGDTTITANATSVLGNAISGGAGTGGDAALFSNGAGGNIEVRGNLTVTANGTGGFGGSFVGGAGTGGSVYVGSSSDPVVVTGTLDLRANGTGGDGADGGAGVGGVVTLMANGLGSIRVNGNVALATEATGGSSFSASGIGGAASGGRVYIIGDNGAVRIGGTATLDASAFGVASGFETVPGSTLQGGYAEISSSGSGAVVIGGNTSITANAIGASGSSSNGGSGVGGDARAGTAIGGTILITTLNANASGGGIDLRGGLQLTADATGSAANYVAGAANATGGRADIFSGANRVHVGGDVSMSAQGQGGDGSQQFGFGQSPGSDGTGGTLRVTTGTTGDLQIDGMLTMNAAGRGGSSYSGEFGGSGAGGNGVGGVGTGGNALIFNQGTMRIGGAGQLSVQGIGGTVFGGGEGGDGIGGVASVFSENALMFDDSLSLDAFGGGASAQYTDPVDGGDGLGGTARIETTTSAATIVVAGATTLRTAGNGGNGGAAAGTIGGDGIGGFGAATANGGNGGGLVIATAGSIDLAGGVTMLSGGSGGQGATGGNGVGGSNALSALAGRLTVGGLASLDARGTGGAAISGAFFGFGGGSGGYGLGGSASIGTTGPGNGVGASGFVEIDSATIDASATGGSGADGFASDGGAGGAATGGSILVRGEAGSIGLTAGAITARVFAIGGGGGAGADGLAGNSGATGQDGQNGGAGFRGGIGGDASAGSVTLGSFNADAELSFDAAVLSYGDITVDAHALAGAGGVGGDGGLGGRGGVGIGGTQEGENGGRGGAGGAGGDGGAGGAGGIAAAGQVSFLVQKLRSTTGDISVDLTATGGNGALGGTGGGNGAGGLGGESGPGGTVGAPGMTGPGTSVDGAGGAGGDSTGGSILIRALDGADLTFGNFGVTANSVGGLPADLFGGTYGTAFGGAPTIGVLNADATFDRFDYVGFASVPQAATIEVDGGTLTFVDALNLDLPGDLAFQVHDDGLVAGGDILLRGNGAYTSQLGEGGSDGFGRFDIAGQFRAMFFGSIDINPSVRAGSISLYATNAARTTTLTADGDVDVRANRILTGDVLAGQSVTMNTGEGQGDLITGRIDATLGTVALFTEGAIGTGPITAGNSIFLTGMAGVTTQSVTAALTPPDAEAGVVRILSRFGPVAAGNIAGSEIFITQGAAAFDAAHDLTVGDLLAEKITVLGRGNVTTGNITTIDRFGGYDPVGGYQSVINADRALRIGSAEVRGNLILRGGGSGGVTAGALGAGGSIAIFSTGDVTIAGAHTATGAGDTLFVGDAGLLGPADFAGYDRSFVDGAGAPFDTAILRTLSPIGLTGAFASSGPISTGFFTANADILALGAVDASGGVALIGGQIGVGTVRAGGALALDVARGVQAGDLSGASAVRITGAGTSGVDVRTGSLVSSGGSVTVSALGGGIASGGVNAAGAVDMRAGTGMTLGTVVAARNSPQGTVRLTTRAGGIAAGDVTGNSILVEQGAGANAGAVVLGNLAASGVTVTGPGAVTTGNIDAGPTAAGGAMQLVVSGAGNVTTGNIAASGTLILSSRGGNVAAGALATPGSAAIFAGGDVTIGGASTGITANDTVFVSNAAILGATPFAGYDRRFQIVSGGGFDPALLRSSTPSAIGGMLTSGAISTGVLRASATSMSFGAIDARQRIELNASGLAAFAGLVDSPIVGIVSGDIDITQGGAIGTAATQTITLTRLGDAQPIIIGGDGSGTGYRLSNAEAQRLHAHTIDIVGGAGTMTVRDLTLAGSASGANANLTGSEFNLTGGVVRIVGALGLTGAGAADRVSVVATNRIEVVTDAGGAIALRGVGSDAAAVLSGVLDLQAPVIGVASDALLTQLAVDPRFAGRNALLGAPAVTPRPEGYIQAGRIELATGNVLAIQNSGSAALAAGFTAGAGGMQIRPLATAQGAAVAPQVVIYGRVQNAAGAFLTNLDTVGGITLATANGATFDPASFVNGCRINTTCVVGTDQAGTIISTLAALERVLAADPRYVLDIPSLRLDSLVDEEGLLAEPLITEPVAGAGNPSLWDSGDDDQQEPNGAETATGEKGQ